MQGGTMMYGGCLCGSVRYQIRGPLSRLTPCPCSMCRRAHGAAFGSYARVNWTDFSLLSGEDDVASFQSSPGVQRTFCRRCGSTLQFVRESRPQTFSLAVGTLDSDPGIRPSVHIFVGSKAPWFEITDGLPQHEEREQVA